MARRYYPYRGKWTVRRLVKHALEANGGEMGVEELLDHMKRLGYLREPIRRSLGQLDVEVAGGRVRLKEWVGG